MKYLNEALIKKNTKISNPRTVDEYKSKMSNIILSIIDKDKTIKVTNELEKFINNHIDKWFDIVKYDETDLLGIVPICNEITFNNLKKYFDDDFLKPFKKWNHYTNYTKKDIFDVGQSPTEALKPRDVTFINISDDKILYITYNNPNFCVELNVGDIYFMKNINLS